MEEKFKKILNVSIDTFKKVVIRIKTNVKIELIKSEIREMETQIGRLIYDNNIDTGNNEINMLIDKIKKNNNKRIMLKGGD